MDMCTGEYTAYVYVCGQMGRCEREKYKWVGVSVGNTAYVHVLSQMNKCMCEYMAYVYVCGQMGKCTCEYIHMYMCVDKTDNV